MRKRSNLISRYFILFAVLTSAFFFVPVTVYAVELPELSMSASSLLSDEISAQALSDLSIDVGDVNSSLSTVFYTNNLSLNSSTFDLYSGSVVDNQLYKVTLHYKLNFTFNVSLLLRNISVAYGDTLLNYHLNPTNTTSSYKWQYVEYTGDYFIYGSDLKANSLKTTFRLLNSSSVSYTADVVFSGEITALEPVSSSNTDDYNNGYQAGYNAGQTAGYDSGYNSGYSKGQSAGYSTGYNAGYSKGEDAGYEAGYQQGVASVDTQSYYENGYQAGVNSVDTQSYYNNGYQAGYTSGNAAGYQSGYTAGYSEGEETGYEAGYSAGYDDAMSRIEQWGADTTEYPVVVASGVFDNKYAMSSLLTYDGTSSEYVVAKNYSFENYTSLSPNHVYRFDYQINGFRTNAYLDSYEMNRDSYHFQLFFDVGPASYVVNPDSDTVKGVFFIPGDRIGNSFSMRGVFYDFYTTNFPNSPDITDSLDVSMNFSKFYYKIYDCGPSGDTQNHIANQTDDLTNGYDDTDGNDMNNDLDNSINDYETAEDSLFASVSSGLDDFTFFDFESVPAMLTGITFVTSIMTGMFQKAGGASGVGIVLSVLFSVMIASMVIGLYRLYQSSGHRGGDSKGEKDV